MDILFLFKEAIIISLIIKICSSDVESNQVFRPDPSLPKELNDFLLDVHNHRNDFQCIRYITNKARRQRKSSEKFDNRKNSLRTYDNNPINDIYPYMYKTDKINSNARRRRQLRREINVVPESSKGQIKLTDEKYPNRMVRGSQDISKSDKDTNLNKRNVEIEIKENGKLVKEIQDDSNQPKSIILNLSPSTNEMSQNFDISNGSENNDEDNSNTNKLEISNEKFKLLPKSENEKEMEQNSFNKIKEPELKVISNENQQINPDNSVSSNNLNILENDSYPHKYLTKLYKNCKLHRNLKDNFNQKYKNGFEEVKAIAIDNDNNLSYGRAKLRRDVDKAANYDSDILRDYSNDNLYSYRHNNFIDDDNDEFSRSNSNKIKSEKLQKKNVDFHHKFYKNKKEKRNDERTYLKSFGSDRNGKYSDKINLGSSKDSHFKLNEANEKEDQFDFELTEAPAEESPVSVDQKSDLQGELLVGQLFNNKDQQKDQNTCDTNKNYLSKHFKTRSLKEFKQFYNALENNDDEYVYEDKNYDRFEETAQTVSETTVRVKSQAAEGDYNDEEDSFTSKEKSKKFNKVKKTSNEFANPPPTTTDNSVYDDDDDDDKRGFYNKNTNGLAHFGKHGRISKKRILNNATAVREKLGKRSLDVDQDLDQVLAPLSKFVSNLEGAKSTEKTVLRNSASIPNEMVRKIRKNDAENDQTCTSSVQTTPTTLDITDIMTCTSESNNMKVELLLNGKLPDQIVQHVLSIAQNTEKYKKFYNGLHKTPHSEIDFEGKTNNLNTCSLMNSISKLINTFLQSSSSACLLLADATHKYLENILNVQTNTFTTESDIDENAEYDNHQNDMLFHKNSMSDHENKDTNTEKCDNSYDSLKSKVAALNGLVEKYNSMSQNCQQKAKSVKKYIDNHLEMLTNKLNVKNNGDLQTNDNSNEKLINEQLQSVGLGKDQIFRPNFDVNSLIEGEMKPNQALENNNNVASAANVKKRQVSTRQSKKYKKLLDAVAERHQKRETSARIGQIFGQKSLHNGEDVKLESPLVFSLN